MKNTPSKRRARDFLDVEPVRLLTRIRTAMPRLEAQDKAAVACGREVREPVGPRTSGWVVLLTRLGLQ